MGAIKNLSRLPAWSATPIRREFVGGLTTFLTMVYIVIVNPSILSAQGTGIPFSSALTATVLLSCLLTIFMGVYAGLPFAVAPGMGINAFFAYTIILKNQTPWPVAFGMIFWAGVLFLLISATPLREAIARAIPRHLRIGASVGIGLFLTFIGLKNSGFIVADPVTFVRLGPMSLQIFLLILGVIVGGALLARKHPFALLAPIVLLTLTSAFLGEIKAPESYFSSPDFSMFFQLDIFGSLKLALLPAMISICMTDLFDSVSTFVGVSSATGLVDEKGEPLHLRRGLIVDAVATFTAGLFGTSSGTAYIESAAGIEAGARTGWASIFTGLLFLPCLFIAPLAGLVPAIATAPILILVGALMFRSCFNLQISKMEDLIPTFVTLVLIPLTFSISQGILWGFILHPVLYLLVGRRKDLHTMNYVLAALSLLLLFV